jgi:hypothetical protein
MLLRQGDSALACLDRLQVLEPQISDVQHQEGHRGQREGAAGEGGYRAGGPSCPRQDGRVLVKVQEQVGARCHREARDAEMMRELDRPTQK